MFILQQVNVPARYARNIVELLCHETRQSINPDMWPANDPDLNQQRVYQVSIQDADLLKVNHKTH